MGYISRAKYFLEAYYDTDDPGEQIETLENAVSVINTLIDEVKKDNSDGLVL